MLPVTLAVIVAVVVSSVLDAVRRADREVLRASEAIALANEYLSIVVEAEAGERDFVITGQEHYLSHYEAAPQQLSRIAARLRELAAGTPAQRERVEEMEALQQRWRREVGEPLIAARRASPVGLAPVAGDLFELVLELRVLEGEIVSTGAREREPLWSGVAERSSERLVDLLGLGPGPDSFANWRRVGPALMTYRHAMERYLEGPRTPAARDTLQAAGQQLQRLTAEASDGDDGRENLVGIPIARGDGKALLDAVRTEVAEFVSAEKSEFERRLAAAARTQAAGAATAIVGPITVVILGLGLALGLTYRSLRSVRSVAYTAGRLAEGDSTARAEVIGHDETATMARNFNRMADQLQRRDQEVDLLTGLSQALQSCHSLEEAGHALDQLAPGLMPGGAGAVYLLAESRNQLTRHARWGSLAPAGYAAISPDDCWAIRRGQTHLVEDPNAGLVCMHDRADPPRPYLCRPLVAHGDLLGLMTVSESGSAPRLDASLRRVTEAVAGQLGLSIANLKLREMLHNQSIRDPLTGLFNRRYLEETLEREIARATRAGQSVAVAMLDIDLFKVFNDAHGHESGDAVLRAVAGLLAVSFRGGDLVGRYGGEEFVVILPDSATEGARARLDEVRERVSTLEVAHDGKTIGPVTISAGVAALPVHGRTAPDLLRRADHALYVAKRAGRNRVEVAPIPG